MGRKDLFWLRFQVVPDIVGWGERHNECQGGARRGGMGMPTSTDFSHPLWDGASSTQGSSSLSGNTSQTLRSLSPGHSKFFLYGLFIDTHHATGTQVEARRQAVGVGSLLHHVGVDNVGTEHDHQTRRQVPFPV